MKKNYFLALICFLSFTGISLSQTTYFWRNPEAINGNWEESTNWWNGTMAELPGGGEILKFDNNHETTMTNDLVATNRHRIFFDASATTSRTISGATENTFFDFNFGTDKPKIENSSTALHTLNFPIKIGFNPMEINPVNGDLTIGGAIDFQGNYLDIYGDNTKVLTFNGVLSGTGGISIQQNSKAIFNAVNTFTGQTTINRGDLEVKADMASGIEVNNDGNLIVDTDLSIPYLTLNNTATVTINAGKSLTISGNLTNNSSNSIVIEAGGSLMVSGTSTGNITYNVAIADDKWHLVSSPVVGEQYNDDNAASDWVTTNAIAPGTNSNVGIATYDNGAADTDTDGGGSDTATGHWRYFQAGGAATTFGSGVGYSLKRTGAGNYTFTGTYPEGTITPAISQSVNNWNLIGNPYPSYINIATFISDNTANLGAGAFQAIYVWNASTSSYDDLTTGQVHPGQAFFINSNVASGNASITEAMQSHQTGITFYKSVTPSIGLSISNGVSTKKTKINYLDNKTASLDPGFDIGMFNGVASDLRIYTHLIENNEGIAFARQALPNSDLESMIIPIGVKAEAGKEIAFSAETLNLPTGIKVFFEDRVSNTFTRLDEANSEYKITLKEAINGVGRFYLHTKQSVLNVDDFLLNGVSIFKTNASTIRVAGLPQGKATVSLFNITGKQIMTTSFNANGVKDISLPKLATGVYFAKVQTETGKLNKKIILD